MLISQFGIVVVKWQYLLLLAVMVVGVLPSRGADAEKSTASSTDSKATIKTREKERQKICIGTNGRMSVPSNRDHHYRNLRDRYTNCTYVDGNLELTWLQDEQMDLSFLQYIREVTGYVLISHVDVSKIVLPRLQIIRGRTLFKLNIDDNEFALMVTLSKMNTLELPGLRDILSGSVGLFNNYNLCHIRSINWDEILTGTNATSVYVYNFTSPERECPACHKSCTAGCWGEGPHNCQKFSKINCSPQCSQGRCFGPEPRQCCHLFCAGGCTGPKQNDCLACRSVYDDGVCTQECPPMQRYNPVTYSWETNPNGKYAYGATCVKNCPSHLLKDNGACVKNCPATKMAFNGECILCDGPCPKTCKGVNTVHNDNVMSFKDCNIIEGSITILDTSFQGFQHFYENLTIGPKVGPMAPHMLEVFSSLKEITGFLNIQGYHENFTSLSYFRNLEVIGGRETTQALFASVYIVKTSLKYLGLTSLKQIHSGAVVILENDRLCYTEGIDWKRLKKTPDFSTYLQNNKNATICQMDGEVCDAECKNGCWGPGPQQCIACANVQFGDRCLSSCDVIPGLYKANLTHCMPCHEECESVCNGPGPEHCKVCKHVRNGQVCASSCPDNKYNSNGECKLCHPNCDKGCHGPENYIGPNGCVSCDKAIINGNEVERCLRANETCPDGYYAEWLGPYESGPLKPLSGKEVCRRCHPRCKKCTGYGFSEPLCVECVHYKRDLACEEECPISSYANNATHQCLPCHSECIDCYGPDSTNCYNCRYLKVFLDYETSFNTTAFNCTASCPPELPYKTIPEDNSKPYCSVEPVSVSLQQTSLLQQNVVLLVTFVFIMSCAAILGVFMYRTHVKQKDAKLKEKMIMNGVEDESSFNMTDVSPNMSELKIFAVNQIQIGDELGAGAFGKVYKGILKFKNDVGETSHLPVAIKILKEGKNPDKNKEMLNEAYYMATVHHKNLLKLVGVCMTNEMMIITPMMPLGCLLNFVKSQKNFITPKMMLTWCQEIAEGMEYLEGKNMIHRDLAARNVLLNIRRQVKITDFGLARMLDMNEEEYKADGSKVPVKWLALECIQEKIFTHKSDVWAYGVTVWEVLTYGQKPYDDIPHSDLPDLLKKGQRLRQPEIATAEVYKAMLNCWFESPDSRPPFSELVKEFKKMALTPQKYLRIPWKQPMNVIEGDVGLPFTGQSDNTIFDSEDYLQPSCSNIGIPIDDDPFSQPRNWEQEILQFTSGYPNHFTSLKDNTTSDDTTSGSSSKREVQIGNMKLGLPLDDDDYLMPSPQRSQSCTTTGTSAAYMDLISDSRPSDENQNSRLSSAINFNGPFVYNLEYHHMMPNEQKLGIPQVHQLQHRSSEEESDHEYYNELDRLQREKQPLRRNRNETPV